MSTAVHVPSLVVKSISRVVPRGWVASQAGDAGVVACWEVSVAGASQHAVATRVATTGWRSRARWPRVIGAPDGGERRAGARAPARAPASHACIVRLPCL